MAIKIFKPNPFVPNPIWDEYNRIVRKENLKPLKELMKNTRYTSSGPLIYSNHQECHNYFLGGSSPYDVEVLTGIAKTTIKNHFDSFVIDHPEFKK